MTIKMIVSDLDGTLLTWDKMEQYGVTASNDKAVRKILNSDVHFCIATGRPQNFLSEKFNPVYNFDTVSYTGAMARAEERQLGCSEFSFEEALSFEAALSSYTEVNLLCITKFNDYVFSCPNQKMMDLFMDEDPALSDHREILNFPLNKYVKDDKNDRFVACVFLCEDIAYLNSIIPLIQEALPQYDYIKTRPDGCSIMKKGVNKGSGVQKIMDYYGFKPQEVAVIGDSHNDIEMFQCVPHSYCIESAQDEVKAHAAYIVSDFSEAVGLILKETHTL